MSLTTPSSARASAHPVLAGRSALTSEGIAALPEVHPRRVGRPDAGERVLVADRALQSGLPALPGRKTVPELGRGERAEGVAATLAGSGVLGVDVSGGEPLPLHSGRVGGIGGRCGDGG